MFAPFVIHVHSMNDRLAALEKEAERLRRKRNAARAEVQRPKRGTLMVAPRPARAEAKLNRRGHSRLNDQNGPLFEVMLRLLALACKRMSPEDQLEISASNVWHDRIVHAPKFLKFS
ncbi:hypothetical protein SAMN05414139_09921 [Burkholderia sp. D7]|nr:hypothetical protein SAMN05414139_09921 [Burkholderia sp. D7]